LPKGLTAAAFATFVGLASPASAATFTTTTSTCFVNCADLSVSSVAAFDSGLGTLTGITLQIDGLTQSAYQAFSTFPATTGSADLSFQGPFNATVNGTAYSFDIVGSQHVTVADIVASGIFSATGTGTFNIAPSLFGTFIDAANVCKVGAIGVCVSSFQNPPSVPASAGDLTFSNVQAQSSASYTLTYTYTPAVPETASWAMMLLGFGAIGYAMRRRPLRLSAI